MNMLLLLLAAHSLADFPLQGDYLAKFKAPVIFWPRHAPAANGDFGPRPNPLWIWHMAAHCMIHAGFVLLLTGSVWLGLAEFVTHGVIDLLKCRNRLTFSQDQALHIACKACWWLLA